jgi:hypothetical protein
VGRAVAAARRLLSPTERLGDLDGLMVEIETTADADDLPGYGPAELRAKVESRLRRAAIPVRDKTRAALTLSVSVMRLRATAGYVITTELGLSRLAYLPLGGDRVGAAVCRVWSRERYGWFGAAQTGSMRETIDGHLDEFVNDFLTANLK